MSVRIIRSHTQAILQQTAPHNSTEGAALLWLAQKLPKVIYPSLSKPADHSILLPVRFIFL